MTYASIFDLLLRASFSVKFIMLILVLFSITSWALIIQKMRILSVASSKMNAFEEKFWSGAELSQIYQESQSRKADLSGMEQIFYSGFREFMRLHQPNKYPPRTIIEGISRAMRISMNRELEILETNIPLLGTIASISPYVGLFGTVLGILNTFVMLSVTKQITMQMIAPGIAESLAATAVGLFTAIPAVIAYNRLNQRMNELEVNYDNFMEEFTAILYRQLLN